MQDFIIYLISFNFPLFPLFPCIPRIPPQFPIQRLPILYYKSAQMKQTSGSKYSSKYTTSSLLGNKPIEQSRLQSQIILLKNKLRSNRNIETRKKLEYRIGVVEQDITEFKSRQTREKALSKQIAEQLEKEIAEAKANFGNLETKAKGLRDEQEALKADVAEKMAANKELNAKVTGMEKARREKIDQVSKLERVHRLASEELKQTEFLKEKYGIQYETITKKIENYSQKYEKIMAVNKEWQGKVDAQEKTLNEESEKMKSLFKVANNAIVEEEKSMHKNIALKDEHRQLEHRARDTHRKLQQIIELWQIEQQRNDMITQRIKQINQLIESVDIPEDLDKQVEKQNENSSQLKIRLANIQQQNKKKQKTNEQVIQKLHSLCSGQQLIRNYLYRTQTVRQLEAKCKIEQYTRMSSSQSRAVYDSHRKQQSLYNTGYIANLGGSGFLSSSAQKSSTSRLIDRYLI